MNDGITIEFIFREIRDRNIRKCRDIILSREYGYLWIGKKIKYEKTTPQI